MPDANHDLTMQDLMDRKNVLSPKELSGQVDVSYPTLLSLSKGETGRPQQRTLEELADYFGITVEGMKRAIINTRREHAENDSNGRG